MTIKVTRQMLESGNPNFILGYDINGDVAQLDPSIIIPEDSNDIINVSGVTGGTVTDALNNLESQISSLGGSIGSNDVTNQSSVSGSTVTAALNTLNSSSGGSTGLADVGTYLFAGQGGVAGLATGGTVGGASIRVYRVQDINGNILEGGQQGFSGTWRNMGATIGSFGGGNDAASLFVRIA